MATIATAVVAEAPSTASRLRRRRIAALDDVVSVDAQGWPLPGAHVGEDRLDFVVGHVVGSHLSPPILAGRSERKFPEMWT